jgi:hypothetical protein
MWAVVVNTNHLQLSAVDPPDARRPGPVIGPDTRVRACDGAPLADSAGVVCLEVDVDGEIERGYTVRRMLMLDSDPPPPARIRPYAIATPMVLALVVALILVLA